MSRTPPPDFATASTAAMIAVVSLCFPSPAAEYGSARTLIVRPQQFGATLSVGTRHAGSAAAPAKEKKPRLSIVQSTVLPRESSLRSSSCIVQTARQDLF